MLRFKKFFVVILAFFIVILMLLVCNNLSYSAYAEVNNHILTNNSEVVDNEKQSSRLFTSLSISLNGGDGKVWTTVKNDFTLFPSTVLVIVQLYSSYTYCESYTEMTLVSENSTTDLNMGETIIAESSTGGEQKYWMGRMRYKIDGKSWEERTVGVLKYSAAGDYIGIL